MRPVYTQTRIHINIRLDGFLYVLKHDKLIHQVNNKVRDQIWNQVQIQIYRQIKQNVL
jgi:hypothetical protein